MFKHITVKNGAQKPTPHLVLVALSALLIGLWSAKDILLGWLHLPPDQRTALASALTLALTFLANEFGIDPGGLLPKAPAGEPRRRPRTPPVLPAWWLAGLLLPAQALAQRPLTAAEKRPGFVLPRGGNPLDPVLVHRGYTVRFNPRLNVADWVAYPLNATDMAGSTEREGSQFAPDPLLASGPVPGDYSASGFDRGHLAPAGDFHASRAMMDESFYMANMTPQRPLFNRGIWKSLEEQVRRWAVARRGVYVATGPVLPPARTLPTIGRQHRVAVPDEFYKVVLYCDTVAGAAHYELIGFVLANQGSDQPLTAFVVPVRSIEQATGLTFFPLLPPPVAAALKTAPASRTIPRWFTPQRPTKRGAVLTRTNQYHYYYYARH